MTPLLYRIRPIRISQKTHTIKKIFPKLIYSLNRFNQILNKLNHTKRRMTRMIILLPKRTSQFQLEIKTIMIKHHKIKHTYRSITHTIILPTKRMSKVQVTEKIIMMKNQYINMENQ